jgi:hypothetical protein
VNPFIGYSLFVTTINYNTVKIAVIIAQLQAVRLRTDCIENTSHSYNVLYALPSNELFTKNLSSRELVYRAVA